MSDNVIAEIKTLSGEWRGFVSHLEKTAQDPWTVLRLSVRISAFCIIVSLIISQNLWFQDHRLLLPTPLFSWASRLPASLNIWLYMLMLSGSLAIFIHPGKFRRLGLLLAVIFVFLVLQDQVRWQFYLYMHFFNLLVAALLPREIKDWHLDPLRYMVIGVYFWAGFYKINPYFSYIIFPEFISSWFPYASVAKVFGLVVPFIELSVALLLFLPKTRRLGQFFACGMLLVVVVSLGPFGKNVFNFIWPANVYLDALAVFLFLNKKPLLPQKLKSPFCLASVALFIVLPAFGIINSLGHHQSFKLFCCAYSEMLVDAKGTIISQSNAFDPGRSFYFGTEEPGLVNITSYPVFQQATPYLSGYRGECPFLEDPEKVRLYVVDDQFPFWSSTAQLSIYDICAKEPHLLSRKTVAVSHGF
jgi:hypothetical protein